MRKILLLLKKELFRNYKKFLLKTVKTAVIQVVGMAAEMADIPEKWKSLQTVAVLSV